jgi:hypothetical protein
MILLIDSFLVYYSVTHKTMNLLIKYLNFARLLEYLAVTSWTFQALLVTTTVCTAQLQLNQDLVPAATPSVWTSHQLPRAGILSCKMNPTGKGRLTMHVLIAPVGRLSNSCCSHAAFIGFQSMKWIS